jgi:colicin import membrane protein
MSEEKKKSLFDKAIDALTDRDEKEAAAAQASAQAEAVRKEVEARAKAAAERVEAEKAAAKAAADKAAALKATAEKAAAIRVAAQKAADEKAAAAPKKGVVTVRSLRIRADHNTTSEVVAGLVAGDEVMALSTWSDGRNTWAKLDKGWAAMVYEGEEYIKLA